MWDERFGRRGMGVFVMAGGGGKGKSGMSGKFKGVGRGEEILVR